MVPQDTLLTTLIIKRHTLSIIADSTVPLFSDLHDSLNFAFTVDDNEWKRKYFQEKKTTAALEERMRKTKNNCLKIENELEKTQSKAYKGEEQMD